MSWGYNSGCDLLGSTCVNDGISWYPNMFCTSAGGLVCTSDHLAMGSCFIQQYDEDLPPEYQYFADPKTGGFPGQFMEYCPFINAYSGTECINGDEEKMPGSLIGASSRCVNLDRGFGPDNFFKAVCVEVRCMSYWLFVRYKGSEEFHPCPPGATITPNSPFFAGNIVCPRYEDVCTAMGIDAGPLTNEAHPS